ncbi:adenosylcobinamide-phosphate synthase CbiB [Undibacterium sp. RuTC16W]|uniref:adenosylcobinamide-phosphate synthase CbiB n=1 Tax=Undibacterium sp. RuTC16W TaxID=3413048 RepID=UPI003BF27C55
MFLLTPALVLLCVVLGLVWDRGFGEVRHWHPLVGVGWLANRIESSLNHDQHNDQHRDQNTEPDSTCRMSYLKGALAWCVVVLPIVVLTQMVLIWCTHVNLWLAVFAHAGLLYFCLGLQSLREHAEPIFRALERGDLAEARRRTSYIVSRDTAQATEQDLSKAAVESVLENGCDAVFAALFWFVLLGGAGAVLYRLSNTLDAMWGYRSLRFLYFGRLAARVDDGLNWVPARMTAISYAVLGNTRLALQCWRQQAPAWPSPNAGPVMAAGAGALELSLGGVAMYDGVAEQRPVLGAGPLPVAMDIQRAWRLVRNTSLLWLGCLAVMLIPFM